MVAIPSPFAGKITAIKVAQGDSVPIGAVIMLIEAGEAASAETGAAPSAATCRPTPATGARAGQGEPYPKRHPSRRARAAPRAACPGGGAARGRPDPGAARRPGCSRGAFGAPPGPGSRRRHLPGPGHRPRRPHQPGGRAQLRARHHAAHHRRRSGPGGPWRIPGAARPAAAARLHQVGRGDPRTPLPGP